MDHFTTKQESRKMITNISFPSYCPFLTSLRGSFSPVPFLTSLHGKTLCGPRGYWMIYFRPFTSKQNPIPTVGVWMKFSFTRDYNAWSRFECTIVEQFRSCSKLSQFGTPFLVRETQEVQICMEFFILKYAKENFEETTIDDNKLKV